MAVRSGLFNSVNGDRKYKAEHFAEYFATFISSGVFPNPSTGFQVVENTNMTVAVKDGKAWINGYYAVNEGSVILSLANADGVLNRIDRVVLRYDTENRIIDIALKQGTFATNPVAPTLQRDADAYEIALADIYIGKGVTAITQTNITDLRLNGDLCGIVHGLVNQVDTTTLFNQYQSFFDTWSVQKKAEFEAWVDTLEGILSGDVAGNLLTLINENKGRIQDLIKQKTNITILSSNWTFDDVLNLYKYKLDDSDITADSIVDVNIHVQDIPKARSLLSANESFEGYVQLYANSGVDSDLVVDYRITKEVTA